MSNYVYGSNLSYRDYLQAKSFEDSFRSEISKQTRSIIASSEQMQKEHISVSKSLQTSVDEGFEQLSFDVQALTAGVSELTAAFHWGFSELLTAVGQANASLFELVRMAKTPAQTWAYEQFEIARDAFRQGLYPEALEYINRAINGYVGNTGYKLEYRFHYLWGTILLGSSRNTSKDILNLPYAENAFLNSARYARQDQPKEAGRAFLAAGWAAYCQGKMEAAEQHTEQALTLSPALAEAHFQLAKIQMHVGEFDRGLLPLRRAVELERAYSIKAAADDDFKRHEAKVQALLNTLRHEAREKAKTELLRTKQQAGDTEKQRVGEFSLTNYAELTTAKRALEDAVSAVRVDTYFGYLDAFSFCGRAKQSLQQARTQFVAHARAEIQQKISGIKSEIARVPEEVEGKWTVLFIFGLVVSVIVGFVQCGRAEGFEASFKALIGNSALFALLSAIVTFIGYQTQKGNALAALNRERERLQLIDSEFQKI